MARKKTILIVDDDLFNRKMLTKLLGDSYLILEAVDGRSALEVLDKYSSEIDGIVLDLVMPVMDGYEFLRVFSENEAYKNIPVLVATSDDNNNAETLCLELGAWDFIRKPFDDILLKLRLKNIIARSQLCFLEQLKYVIEHDPLTGLYNREKFFVKTRQLLDDFPNETFLFIRFDIERFKQINSFLGENEGNQLLQFVAESIRNYGNKVSHCTYGRIGADVFCFCAPLAECNVKVSVDRAKRLLMGYNYNYYIEPSFGVYIIDDPTISVEKMYERAFMASKKCKNMYMNYVAYYDQSMSEALVLEQSIINEMQGALDNEQFEVYFQPKYILQTNKPFGAEALVRWNHPDKGIILPGQFIPVFESNGFIGKLDYYMWEKVCKLLRKWLDEGLNPDPISVNVSRANMHNPHLDSVLAELIKQYDIPAKLLNLEITESSYMDNPEQMKKMVANLKNKGFVILMDDFGSGYSSLNTLKDIDVDILKIDMKFLPTGGNDSRSERILTSVLRLADRLDLPVIVEGVETQEQTEFLQSIGCNYVQGFYFARPMPLDDYEKIVKGQQSEQHYIPQNMQKSTDLDSLWSSNQSAEQIFKNVMQPISVMEYSHGYIQPLRFNRAFIELFGLEEAIENVNGKPGKHISAEDKLKIKNAIETTINQKSSVECEYQWIAERHTVMWIRVKLQYVKSVSEGHMLFAIFSDITEQKKLECELHNLRKQITKQEEEKKVVLIVDDSVVSRSVIKTMLQEHYKVLEAENGRQALSFIQIYGNEIAVILLDIIMPVMDGETFLKHKGVDPLASKIPVIVISAVSDNDAKSNTIKMGATAVVTKPFTSDELLLQVRKAIIS